MGAKHCLFCDCVTCDDDPGLVVTLLLLVLLAISQTKSIANNDNPSMLHSQHGIK